ncbi:MAG: YggS family pyridoxal phosphate-dependent enzyme [Woeseiaceae bacterium]|nr:YggS family pyridoxal phosphate-dependent enzyme [Woeseiaceae bacterium]
MIRVTENLPVIRDLLATAAKDAGRDPDSVRLLAVSKRQPLERVVELAAAGHRDFGENQVQEALDKLPSLKEFPITWHFIGSIQSNKTRAVATHFDWVHAVDRVKIARRLSDQRPEELGDLNICLQVNIDDEASKSGVRPDQLEALATACVEMPRLRLRGLMCLPAVRENLDEQRRPFARLRQLKDELARTGIDMDTLSMGMSGDFKAAILEGATIVRVGTALFGPRPT